MAGPFRNDCAKQFWSEAWRFNSSGHTTLQRTGAFQQAALTQVCSQASGISHARPRRIKTEPSPNRRCEEKIREEIHPLSDRECSPNIHFKRIRDKSRHSKIFQEISKHFKTFRENKALWAQKRILICLFGAPYRWSDRSRNICLEMPLKENQDHTPAPCPFLGRLFKEELLLLSMLEPGA